MAPNVQDHVADEVNVSRDETRATYQSPVERDYFRTIEGIGNSGRGSDWKQRTAAIAVAMVICSLLYGLLYLAMHFQE